MSDPTALPPSVLAHVLTPQAGAQVAPQPLNAQIIEIPPELQNVSQVQTIVAEVVRQSSDGVLTLRADQGDLTLQTSLTFEPHDVVSVRFNGGEVFIRLLSDTPGTLPAPPVLNLEQAAPLSVTQLLETSSLFVTPVTRTNTTSFVQPSVHITEISVGSASTQPPVLAQGSVLSAPPFPPSSPQPLSIVPQIAGDDTADVRVSLPVIETHVPLRSIAAQLPLTQPVTADRQRGIDIAPLQISVTSIQNNVTALQQTQHSLLSTQRAGETRAVFIGLTPEQHFPVFQTIAEQPQLFALRAPVEALPVGSEITLSVTQTQTVLPLNVSLPPIAAAAWQSLNDVQETLVQNATPQVVQAFQAAIPNVNVPAQLSGAILFFLVAVRSGDVQNWLGERVVETLKRAGKGDLVNRIANEFSALTRSDTSSGDWRVMSLPLGWNDQIHRITISYRKDDERGDDGTQTGTQTRFVMDLNLSAMGKVQLDALFSSGSKRLNLIIRTESDFSEAARQKMRGMYKDALDETQITGELSFFGGARDWVTIDTDDNTTNISA